MKTPTFQLPKTDERLVVVGRTGTGKTQGAAWVLSQAPFHKLPYIIFDFKGDELLNSIEHLEEISLKSMPKKPGLYIVHINPGQEDEVENFLWKIWKQEETGMLVDEGYMIDRYSKAFSSVLTQGRSKKIPSIVLSQRPKRLNPFVISEADKYMAFHLNDQVDTKRLQEFFPPKVDLSERLPDFHSRWYDVKQDQLFILKPVPDRASILSTFEERLKPKRAWV